MNQIWYRLLVAMLLLQVSSGCAQQAHGVTTAVREESIGLEIPTLPHGDQLIRHKAFALAYREAHEQASWVAYQLTTEETLGPAERSNRFVPDPKVTTGSAEDADYAGSGYDRGHLAPAGDMTWSEQSMEESFYYSNMSPQVPSFNRGIWKKLETLVRDWAADAGALEIVTGPVLTSGLPAIGPNYVSVPAYYYKVVLDYKEPHIRAAAFLMANEASSEPLQSFLVSVDSVEHLTGIDFFPLLPDEQEVSLERGVREQEWSWGPARTMDTRKQPIEKQDSGDSVQCSAFTRDGHRCRNRTAHSSGRCHIHQ